MNYYKRHLGDYAKDAGHLSLLEHGAFTLLLDRYYGAEHPLTQEEAQRVCRARTADERAAVDYVLANFFTLTDTGYTNKRADAEIEAYNEKAGRNREAGLRGGRPRKSGNPEETQTVSTNNPDGSVSLSEKNPSHKPLATSHKKQEQVEAAAFALIPLKDGSDYAVTASLAAEWRTAYPGVDVLTELAKARAWCVVNPDKRKTRSGAGKFLNAWLSRAHAALPKPAPTKTRQKL